MQCSYYLKLTDASIKVYKAWPWTSMGTCNSSTAYVHELIGKVIKYRSVATNAIMSYRLLTMNMQRL